MNHQKEEDFHALGGTPQNILNIHIRERFAERRLPSTVIVEFYLNLYSTTVYSSSCSSLLN